ncbi:MAG: hypothetical protein H7Y07_01375, partial [Pyrinomonadaceae bacterium]|nr:hypothetical protein [Sphingobacteriaceae bacterium]
IEPIASIIWLAAFAIFIGSFIHALKSSATDARIYKSLTGIPRFIFYQLISLTKIYNANKRSVTTRHFHDKTNDAENLIR